MVKRIDAKLFRWKNKGYALLCLLDIKKPPLKKMKMTLKQPKNKEKKRCKTWQITRNCFNLQLKLNE